MRPAKRASATPATRAMGLTLIEVMVALAILVIVGTSSLLIFRAITRAWQTGELRTDRYQQARLLFDLFERELSSSVASHQYPFVGTKPGDANRIQAESVFDEIFFVGTLPGRTGLVERGYWVTSDGRIMCHDDEPADGVFSTGVSELCGQGVFQFSASYFDGTGWVERWNGETGGAQAGALPKAVQIEIQIGETDPEKFETVIYVPTS